MRTFQFSLPLLFLLFLLFSLSACSGLNAIGVNTSDPNLVNAQKSKAIHLGSSTKSDVSAALGTPKFVGKFDNGYEVWTFPFNPEVGKKLDVADRIFLNVVDEAAVNVSEYVLLFSPQGVVVKTRIRVPQIGDTKKDWASNPFTRSH